ncbi:uncharacterized protein LOC100844227 isoform X2 [Brachypodium distachyon]|uniref:uncharacterized protein LOC100844227 isoform X2 n=1 Tax=Brachypodium distachyon TaxID=15368 RepID=UPI000D0D1C27|nr:uncharacterized protein LOC100844227 isoform X2 [Brachypodium distachyon]|eukprot:XP_024313637.1 uncharacterized protein LOC100844227 isoform X2 [Brachypodium distachyon]
MWWRAAASRLRMLPRPLSPASATRRRNNHLHLFSLQRLPVAEEEAEFTTAEARRVARLVGVEVLKRRLRGGGQEVVGYGELLDACLEAGAARTHAQAEVLARAMDKSGVLLLFRGKAYLQPHKVPRLYRQLRPHDEAAIGSTREARMWRDVALQSHRTPPPPKTHTHTYSSLISRPSLLLLTGVRRGNGLRRGLAAPARLLGGRVHGRRDGTGERMAGPQNARDLHAGGFCKMATPRRRLTCGPKSFMSTTSCSQICAYNRRTYDEPLNKQ